MSNRSLATKLDIQTLPDAIVTLVYRHTLISPSSFERFGDKNRITPAIRKMWFAPEGKGRNLDQIAQDIKAYEQFSLLGEEQIINAVVDFVELSWSSARLESFIKTRIAEQASEKTAISKKLARVPVDADDVQCFVDHALAILPKKKLDIEAMDFLKSPQAYFGPLLEVERCKEDLFDLPESEQKKVIESIIMATQNRPAYPVRTRSRMAKIRSIKKATNRKKPVSAKKQKDSRYADADDVSTYFVHNLETQKLEFHTGSKYAWDALDENLKKIIKRYCLYSRPKSAWISKAFYSGASYLISELKKYGIPEIAPIGERNSFEERLEIKRERAESRAARYEAKANTAVKESNHAYDKAKHIVSFIPPGQPILVGHHSEKRHRRDIERMSDSMRKSVDELKKAEYYNERAAIASSTASASELKNRGFLMRRIEDNQKILNRYKKNWKPGTYEERPGYLDASDKLAFYQKKLSELQQATGDVAPSKGVLKAAGATHIKIKYGGWEKIVRINEKTVTATNGGFRLNQQVPYDRIIDWKPKTEVKEEKKPSKSSRKAKVERLKKGVKKKSVTAKNEVKEKKKPYKASRVEKFERLKKAVKKKPVSVKAPEKAKPKSTAKAKKARQSSSILKKIKEVVTGRKAAKKATVQKPSSAVKKVATKPTGKKLTSKEMKTQRMAATGSTDKMSSVQVIKTGRQVNSMYRSIKSQMLDNPVTHKKVLAPTPKNLSQWAKNPGKYDLLGVDTGSTVVTIRKEKEGKLPKSVKSYLKKNR